MKVIIAALGLLVPSAHTQLTETQKAEILQQHNDLRQQTAAGNTLCANGQNCPAAQSIPDLQWDAGLARLAQDYADTCALDHEDWDTRAYRFQDLGGSSSFSQLGTGENLAWGSCSLDSTGTCSAPYSWGEKEAVCWEYNDSGGINVCDNTATGHFTQMIWAHTQYVGCGWRGGDCTEYGNMLVCNYYPPGNYVRESPYVATSEMGNPVNPPTVQPPTAPTTVQPPTAQPTTPLVVSGDCLHMENSAYGRYFDGTWYVGGTSQGRTYWEQGNMVLEWEDYHSGWAIKTGLGGAWYMYCANEDDVTDCGTGTWTQASGGVAYPSAYIEVSDCGSAFTNEDDEANVNGTSDSDGWKIVLVVVIIGLLLIGAGNAAWCMYMKKQMMGKHNMQKVYNEAELAKNDEEIEVNFEVTS